MLTEESIRKNFILVYELLDEMIVRVLLVRCVLAAAMLHVGCHCVHPPFGTRVPCVAVLFFVRCTCVFLFILLGPLVGLRVPPEHQHGATEDARAQ